jgi:hypothetical protein
MPADLDEHIREVSAFRPKVEIEIEVEVEAIGNRKSELVNPKSRAGATDVRSQPPQPDSS